MLRPLHHLNHTKTQPGSHKGRSSQIHTWVGPVGLLGGGSPESCPTGRGSVKALDGGLGLGLASCQRCGREEQGDRRVSTNSSGDWGSTVQPCPDTCWAGWQPAVSLADLPRKLPHNNIHSGNKGQQQKEQYTVEVHCLKKHTRLPHIHVRTASVQKQHHIQRHPHVCFGWC